MPFDARAAKLLKPGEHLTIAPGLRLEAGKTARTWIYRYKSPETGLMRQTKIGAWPSVSAAAAQAAWERLRAARLAGTDPGPTRPSALPQRHATVRKLCEAYLVGHVERSRQLKGAKEVRRMFDTMLGDVGRTAPEAVTRAVAFQLIDSAVATPVQAGKLKAELGAAWDYAHDAGLLPESAPNWWRQIMRRRLRSAGKLVAGRRVKEKRVLSEPELGELIRWLPNFPATVDDALTLYLWTGTRGSEIMAMEGREVAEEGGVLWWTIPKHKTKNARHEAATALRVPLVGRASAVVRRRIELHGKGWLFPSRAGGHSHQKVIGVEVWTRQPHAAPHKDKPRLPVSGWAPHDLRRSARTLLSSMGCPRDLAEAVLGHMPTGIAGTYDRHRYDAERLEWLTRLSGKLEVLAADRQPVVMQPKGRALSVRRASRHSGQ